MTSLRTLTDLSCDPLECSKPTVMSDETTDVSATQSESVPAEETVTTAPETSTEDAAPKVETKLVNFRELKAGQTIRLHERIIDISAKGEERQRVQVFEGMILSIRGAGASRTLTLRKVSSGVGVEKIFPVNSPSIVKMELVKTAKVRRAKLHFLSSLKRQFKRKLKETYE